MLRIKAMMPEWQRRQAADAKMAARGHLDAADAESALTVKSIPHLPARICQVFQRMPETAK